VQKGGWSSKEEGDCTEGLIEIKNGRRRNSKNYYITFLDDQRLGGKKIRRKGVSIL